MASVTPLLEARDLPGLVGHLRRNWSGEQIAALLTCPDHDARKVAALALSLVGDRAAVGPLVKRLRDRDPMVNQMAEHALWSIWFRCGSESATCALAQGAQAMNDRDFRRAFAHFDRAISLCPDFAEAFNQRAIAWYLLEDYEESAADCRKAVELMPDHFSAWAGLGHCHAHLGRIAEAMACYEKALGINPHLDCIRQAVCELKKQSRC